MATTTPNYGWPVPTDTDYVKDGAAAIEALGDAIDATVFALPAGGLTLITSSTFSAASIVSVNNCFTATYTNYRILYYQTTQSTTSNINLRFRNGGVDRTGSYVNFTQGITSGGAASNLIGSVTVGYINTGVVGPKRTAIDVFQPVTATITSSVDGVGDGTDGSGNGAGYRVGFIYNVQDTNDGFSIFPASGTITGSLKVYGYQD